MNEDSRNNLLGAVRQFSSRNVTTNQDLVTFYTSFCVRGDLIDYFTIQQ